MRVSLAAKLVILTGIAVFMAFLPGWQKERHLFGQQTRTSESTDRKPQRKMTVRFQGLDLSGDIAGALGILWKQKLISANSKTLTQGGNACTVYESLPGGCSKIGTVPLASEINGRNLDGAVLQPGETILFPDVEFELIHLTDVYDPKSKTATIEFEDRSKNWWPVIEERSVNEHELKLTRQAYEITIVFDENVKTETIDQTVQKLRILNPGFVFVGYDPGNAPPPKYHTNIRPTDFVQGCTSDAMPADRQAEIWHYMGERPKGKCPNQGSASPTEIVLIDEQVYKHPDFDERVNPTLELPNATPLITDGHQRCRCLSGVPDGEHGTYMAGLIIAQDNGFGLVGVHPDTTIESVNWNDHAPNTAALAKMIEDRALRPAFQIYLFASQWIYSREAIQRARLAKEDFRFYENGLADRILRRQPLWIVAAGNTEAGEDPEVGRKTPSAPMNLGDLPNVVVVAAYKKSEGRYSILESSNHGESEVAYPAVHLAAPGEDILSTAKTTEYKIDSGTSPAAALTAGVASSMICRYSSYFKTAQQVKVRLQISSRPIFSGAEGKKVATGILDPAIALLDPRQIWYKERDQEITNVSGITWLRRSFNMLNPRNKNYMGTIVVEELRRLVRIEETPGTFRWVAYTKVPDDINGDHTSKVRRLGPGILNEISLLSMEGRPTILTTDVQDLILPEDHNPVFGER